YRTEVFPAVYYQDSGCPVDYRVESPLEVAQVMSVKWALGLGGGLVVANPVPEGAELDPELIEDAVDEGMYELEERGIRGKGVTPYLLQVLHERTEGETLRVGAVIAEANARLAGAIAAEFARLQAARSISQRGGVQMAQAEIGIFGGSGFYTFLDDVEEVWVETPYGPPSDRVALAQVAGRRVAFLPRHGKDHRLPPHRINYRANLWAMKELGV